MPRTLEDERQVVIIFVLNQRRALCLCFACPCLLTAGTPGCTTHCLPSYPFTSTLSFSTSQGNERSSMSSFQSNSSPPSFSPPSPSRATLFGSPTSRPPGGASRRKFAREPKKERGTQLTRDGCSLQLACPGRPIRTFTTTPCVSKTCPHRVASRTQRVQLTRQACVCSYFGALGLAFSGWIEMRPSLFSNNEFFEGNIWLRGGVFAASKCCVCLLVCVLLL